MKKIKKKKAFLGSVFSAVGNLVNAQKQADLQQKQYEYQQGLVYKQEAQDKANILTQEAQNQQYVQQMKNRITFAMGGKKRIKKKKAFLGIASAIGDSVGGMINMFGAMANDPKDYTIKHSDPFKAQAPKVIKPANGVVQQTTNAIQQTPIAQNNPNVLQNPILSQAKMGTKRIIKKNLNRFK